MILSHKIKRKVINQASLLLNFLWAARSISIGGHLVALFPQHPAFPSYRLESGPVLAHCGPSLLVMYIATWSCPLFTRILLWPHLSRINIIYSCKKGCYQ
jgi:hypothetical protein